MRLLKLAVLTYEVGLAIALPRMASVRITQDAVPVSSPQDALGATGCEVSSQVSQMRVPGAGRIMFPLMNLERQREELVEVEG